MQNYALIPPAVEPVVRRTSKLGKTSFMIALSIFLLVVSFLLLAMLFSLTNTKVPDSILGMIFFGWLLAPIGHFAGMVLGIVDVCRKGSKKLTPALGIAGNAILGGIGIGLIFLLLSLIGAAMSVR